MKSTTISVDLAKNVFQVAVSRHPGKVAEAHRLTRTEFLPFFAKHKPALVLLETLGRRPGLLTGPQRRRFTDSSGQSRRDAGAPRENAPRP